MTIRVFVQNEAGSNQKNYHDGKTPAFRNSQRVSHLYPFPYGFVIGTDAGDGGNVDCFVITDRLFQVAFVNDNPTGSARQTAARLTGPDEPLSPSP